MRQIADLIKMAHEMKKKGLTTGEIADELNLSRQTALWLVTHDIEERAEIPRDIYVEWSTIGSSPGILRHISLGMAELIRQTLKENDLPLPDVIAGIATSGIPIATIIAGELNASLCIVKPQKHLWEPAEEEKKEAGSTLSNFADVKGKRVVIVDDIATTGTTLRETMELMESLGATPLAAVVMIDKKGIKGIGNRPVKALLNVGIVEDLDR